MSQLTMSEAVMNEINRRIAVTHADIEALPWYAFRKKKQQIKKLHGYYELRHRSRYEELMKALPQVVFDPHNPDDVELLDALASPATFNAALTS